MDVSLCSTTKVPVTSSLQLGPFSGVSNYILLRVTKRVTSELVSPVTTKDEWFEKFGKPKKQMDGPRPIYGTNQNVAVLSSWRIDTKHSFYILNTDKEN